VVAGLVAEGEKYWSHKIETKNEKPRETNI